MNTSNASLDILQTIKNFTAAAAIPFLAIGLILNSWVLYVISTNSIFYRFTYYLIRINLTSDIISNFASIIGFYIIFSTQLDYATGSILCRILFYIIFSSYGISIFTLSIISIDRYFALVKPTSEFSRKYKKKVLITTQICACIVAVVFTIPSAIYNDVYRDDTSLCDYPDINLSKSIYLIAGAIILFITPCIIIIFSYGSIIRHQNSYYRSEITICNNSDAHIRMRRINKFLLIITASYLLTTWPFFATGIGMAVTSKSLRQIQNENIVYYLFAFISFVTTTGIAILNPFLYLHFDYNIKKASWKTIKLNFTKNRNSIMVR